jgi:hypothetical protein
MDKLMQTLRISHKEKNLKPYPYYTSIVKYKIRNGVVSGYGHQGLFHKEIQKENNFSCMRIKAYFKYTPMVKALLPPEELQT